MNSNEPPRTHDPNHRYVRALDGMAQDGDVETAIIFGTLKALPALSFETIEAHWIDNGAVGQLKEAA